jgi:hypothetical protein
VAAQPALTPLIRRSVSVASLATDRRTEKIELCMLTGMTQTLRCPWGRWHYEFMSTTVVMEEVGEPAELAAAQAQRERFDRNFAWLQPHAQEIYSRHRGKCVCIAGAEPFVVDTP